LKYWRGFLVAAILAAISGALIAFAKAHSEIVDMVYPYMTRIIISGLADWSGSVAFCLWNVLVLALVAALLTSVILMIVLRWNPIQLLGWVLAVVSFFSLFTTTIYGLNDYTSPLAEDIRLEVTESTVSELNEATLYFRDQANLLAAKMNRDSNGDPDFQNFETLAKQAGKGFEVLTYEEAISIFAGSTAPVKMQKLSGNTLSKTYPLTGECVVDPDIPDLFLPFVMCTEMSRRMSISNEEDAKFAAFLSCKANPSEEFQYTAYCLAYYYCYTALNEIPTSTAQACAAQTRKGANPRLRHDLEVCQAFLDSRKSNSQTDVADLLASWYIQNFITPLHAGEEDRFDPLDSSQVDLEYIAPEPTPLPAKKDD